ncbi:MAG: hypothetical protein RLZZ584_113 [Pseudomonadota bacterium]|jgi:hypothetical protein
MNHNNQRTTPDTSPAPLLQDTSRLVLATRIHDLLLREMGQDVDIALMLGPQEYARAVLSLCRSCGSAMLADLAHQFDRLSAAEVRSERAAQQQRIAGSPLRAMLGLAARRAFHLA